MPLAYKSHVWLHAKEASKIVQEQTEHLAQIHLHLRQAEANWDACQTLHNHLDAMLQRDECYSLGKDTMAGVHGPGNPRISRLLMELDEDVLGNSQRQMLETIRSALRDSQEDCETFVLMFTKRHQVQMDINESTKRRHAT